MRPCERDLQYDLSNAHEAMPNVRGGLRGKHGHLGGRSDVFRRARRRAALRPHRREAAHQSAFAQPADCPSRGAGGAATVRPQPARRAPDPGRRRTAAARTQRRRRARGRRDVGARAIAAFGSAEGGHRRHRRRSPDQRHHRRGSAAAPRPAAGAAQPELRRGRAGGGRGRRRPRPHARARAREPASGEHDARYRAPGAGDPRRPPPGDAVARVDRRDERARVRRARHRPQRRAPGGSSTPDPTGRRRG